jgi:hypothetical protein
MKKFFCILTLALLTIGSCDKDDSGSLENEINDVKDNNGAALEQWATIMNSNITALQNIVAVLQNVDNVTGVTTFTAPSPGGYAISFVKSGSIIISNETTGGRDGESPQISVKQDADDVYYWTLNGEWIVAGDNKMRVVGADGSAGASPKIRVNSGTGLWEISYDAGVSWTTTEIKATGDKGDAVFAANGVVYSNSDYVEFTLADGAGKIRVPKYKKLGLNYAQPETFVAGETKIISYTPEGNVAIIKFPNLSADWKVNVDYTNHKFTVTAPATFNSNNRGGEIVISVSDDDEQNTILRTINLISNLGGGGDEGGSGGSDDRGGDDGGGSDEGGGNIGGGGDGTPSGTGSYIIIQGSYSENTITVYYTDGTSTRITKSAENSLGDDYFIVPANNKIIENIVLVGGETIIAGRKADGSNISLNIVDGKLALREDEAVEGYIPIGTYSEFQLIQTRLRGYYRQEANLDLLNREWSPIGNSYTAYFGGIFDGNDHTLANLKISGNNDYAGLFGYSEGAIRNVHVISGSVSGNGSVGGICGSMDSNNALISDCSNASEVSSGEGSIGGVCGVCGYSSSIIACYNTGSVSGRNGYYSDGVGGVCGYSNYFSSITACYNTGSVSGKDYGRIGGVCGSSYTITACYNTGSVSGNGNDVGGVCGSSHTITACYNTGSVLGSGYRVGGVCGYGYSITACYWKDIPGDKANYGTGDGDYTGTTKFASDAWPRSPWNVYGEWGTGDGSDGGYWKSLGSWNGGNPIYPQLWYE